MFQTFRAFFNWYTFIFSIYRVTKYFACSFCYSSVLIFVIVTLLHSKSFLQNCNVSLCCVFHTCLPKIKKLMSYNFKPSRHKYSLLEVLTRVYELKLEGWVISKYLFGGERRIYWREHSSCKCFFCNGKCKMERNLKWIFQRKNHMII